MCSSLLVSLVSNYNFISPVEMSYTVKCLFHRLCTKPELSCPVIDSRFTPIICSKDMKTPLSRPRCRTRVTGTAHTGQQTRGLYLNTLPRDVLMTIIRHLSKRPYVVYWQSYVDCRDALNILRCDGLVMEAARVLFTDLIYGYSKPLDLIRSEYTSLRASRFKHFEQLIMELSPQLCSLAFAAKPAKKYNFYFEECSQLRELTIENWCSERITQPLDKLLESCGNSLIRLCILGNRQMKLVLLKSIIRHCRVLESLYFNDRAGSANMDEFWQVIGRTLKRLKCFSPIPPLPTAEALDCVERHCRQLEDVEICASVSQFPVAEFYKNMGTRLRVLRLSTLGSIPSPEAMGQILSECPNVMVDVLFGSPTEEMLSVLGGCARKLRLECITEPSAYFENVANTLTGLTELRLENLHMDSSKFIEAFFNAPKPNLTKLSVDCVLVFDRLGDGLLRSTSVLETVARTVHSLREFECCSEHLLEPTSFESLLQSNRHLHRFTMTYSYNERTSNLEMASNIKCLVQLLVKYESVVEFQVCLRYRKLFSNQIRNACVPLRTRQLNLIVGDVQYLPRFRLLER